MSAGLDYRLGVTEETAAAAVPAVSGREVQAFQVHLGDVFEGPFDLLLGLIA